MKTLIFFKIVVLSALFVVLTIAFGEFLFGRIAYYIAHFSGKSIIRLLLWVCILIPLGTIIIRYIGVCLVSSLEKSKWMKAIPIIFMLYGLVREFIILFFNNEILLDFAKISAGTGYYLGAVALYIIFIGVFVREGFMLIVINEE